MRMKQTRYLQDDSEIRTKKLGRAKTQTLNCKPDQAQLNEELTQKITIKAKYTFKQHGSNRKFNHSLASAKLYWNSPEKVSEH